jgi:predicted nucleic acid-binding protein|tara:strand:- start:2221 stop:3648 length:1428 start_codon:yes stop_codon:yes gene_type:complete
LIPSTLLFVGILPSSFSESHTIEQIIITIEPPHEEFEDTSNKKDENNNENSNNGSSGNTPTSFVTGSNYALNGIPILINTPEGVRLNDQLTDQRDLEKLEQIHGEKFWERVDKLTYDHYGLANAMFDPLTKNTFFANGGKYSENTNSNFEYYVLERGYDPREPHKVPNNLFTPTKYDLARAVMQKMQDNNANDLNIEKLNELNLEVISPHAFQMTEEQQNIIYHADVENRALSILKDVLPTISSDSNSDSQNTQNNVGNSNQPDSPLTSMPGNNDSFTTQPPLVNNLNEEIFQNTEHIKTVIGQEKFEPNYENHDELILPITEILLSLLLSTSVLIAIFVIRKMIKKQKQNIIIHTKNPELDYIAETQKLLDSAITLYNSHKIKDAYEKFSQSIRFFYSYHYGLTHEVTTFEILEKIKKLSITDYEIIHNCLVLCGIIEFAKHKENKNDFKIYTESFSKIITHTANTTKISGERK